MIKLGIDLRRAEPDTATMWIDDSMTEVEHDQHITVVMRNTLTPEQFEHVKLLMLDIMVVLTEKGDADAR